MFSTRTLIGCFLPLVACVALGTSAQAQTAPTGWKTSQQNGIVSFTPPRIPKGDTYFVSVYPESALKGRKVNAWLDSFAANDPLGPKKAVRTARMPQRMPSVASETRFFQMPNGHRLAAVYTAASRNGRTVGVIRVLASNPTLIKRYQPQFDVMAVGWAKGIQTRAQVGSKRSTARR